MEKFVQINSKIMAKLMCKRLILNNFFFIMFPP